MIFIKPGRPLKPQGRLWSPFKGELRTILLVFYTEQYKHSSNVTCKAGGMVSMKHSPLSVEPEK